jgi:hypothetical protein
MHVDYSIFKFIRNVATAKFEIPVGQDAELAPHNDESEAAIIAKRIAYSVRQLKRKYHEARTTGRLKPFMTKLTNRNLTPKINY